MTLTYEEKDHAYFWDGKKVPGVTEVMKTLGLAKDWGGVPEYYATRGSYVALAVELYLKGTLDESTLDAAIVPYVKQFKDWLALKPNMGEMLLTEEKYYSKELRFAGRLDLVINQSIWDIKCSKKIDKDGIWQYTLQGSAYQQLMEENWQVKLPFKILQLDGSEDQAKEIVLPCSTELWENTMRLYDAKVGRL